MLSGTLGYAVLQPDRRRAAAQRTPEAAATPPLAEAAAPPRPAPPTDGRRERARPRCYGAPLRAEVERTRLCGAGVVLRERLRSAFPALGGVSDPFV